MISPEMRDTRRFLIGAALVLTVWLSATFLWHVTFATGKTLPQMLFLGQDFPVLLFAISALALGTHMGGASKYLLPWPAGWSIPLAILVMATLAWTGHYIVFQDYWISRDEEMAVFASTYLRHGQLGILIPQEWTDYRRALVPEFFNPYGANQFWTAAYLPVNSAILALFSLLGDAHLAPPVLLAIGLFALWRVALRLLPDRMDAVWVIMLAAFSSAQLFVTAMTPYAMTGHFAFNMIWLALFLRGDWHGHLGAALILILAGGLHQWHFPPLFVAPFLFWMVLQRRWAVFVLHAVALLALVIIWAKLYPALLYDMLGPPADLRPAAGVADKVGSLVSRLDKWQPLINISRFMAWNNILLIPLAVLAVVAMGWRKALSGHSIVLPLALGCTGSCALALYQGYGWGFRYMHGFIGPFALLAGFGWIRLAELRPNINFRPIWLSVIIAAISSAFLMIQAHALVDPYAKSYRLIRNSGADIVLVDTRGGMFVTDLVRMHDGRLEAPLVMNLALVPENRLVEICKGRDIGILDASAFIRLGVPRARVRGGQSVQDKRDMLAQLKCGRLLG